MSNLFAAPSVSARVARLVFEDSVPIAMIDTRTATAADHVRDSGFRGRPGQVLMMPGEPGVDALVGVGRGRSPFTAADAARRLPEGDWVFEDKLPEGWNPTQTAIAFALGGYQFTRYKMAKRAPARLVIPRGCDVEQAERVVRGAMLTRDLVNTPANDMLPRHLEAETRKLANAHDAEIHVTIGDDLLAENYPMIHAVGRASTDAPRLIELEWGDPSHPRLALVGKGVCFDSGGLDIKSANGMALMKKDMGGAATVLGLAGMIMDARLPVRLHVLMPAVENAIAGNAFRPGDVLRSRKGLTVEVGNTDAEGRLVLADALTRADESEPELLIDIATLTGAARVAMGPDVPPFYTDNAEIAERVTEAGAQVDDPVWRLPLWGRYDDWLNSDIADLSSTGRSRFAGSITAALFLRRFVSDAKAWAHFDIFAWTPTARPGRPVGGEMQAGRALYAYLKTRFAD